MSWTDELSTNELRITTHDQTHARNHPETPTYNGTKQQKQKQNIFETNVVYMSWVCVCTDVFLLGGTS